MPTSLEYVYPRVCMLAYCIIINTPSKHSKSRNWAIALAALARFNSTYCMHTDVHGKGKYGQKYVLYYYDRYTYYRVV